MSRKILIQQKLQRRPAGRSRQVVVAIAVALSLVAGWTMLAYSGALDSVFRQKGNKDGKPTPSWRSS